MAKTTTTLEPWGQFRSIALPNPDPSQHLYLRKEITKIGRDARHTDITIELPYISGLHCMVDLVDKEENDFPKTEHGVQVTLKDLSRNGIYVNKTLVGKNNSTVLKPGDTISFSQPKLKASDGLPCIYRFEFCPAGFTESASQSRSNISSTSSSSTTKRKREDIASTPTAAAVLLLDEDANDDTMMDSSKRQRMTSNSSVSSSINNCSSDVADDAVLKSMMKMRKTNERLRQKLCAYQESSSKIGVEKQRLEAAYVSQSNFVSELESKLENSNLELVEVKNKVLGMTAEMDTLRKAKNEVERRCEDLKVLRSDKIKEMKDQCTVVETRLEESMKREQNIEQKYNALEERLLLLTATQNSSKMLYCEMQRAVSDAAAMALTLGQRMNFINNNDNDDNEMDDNASSLSIQATQDDTDEFNNSGQTEILEKSSSTTVLLPPSQLTGDETQISPEVPTNTTNPANNNDSFMNNHVQADTLANDVENSSSVAADATFGEEEATMIVRTEEVVSSLTPTNHQVLRLEEEDEEEENVTLNNSETMMDADNDNAGTLLSSVNDENIAGKSNNEMDHEEDTLRIAVDVVAKSQSSCSISDNPSQDSLGMLAK